MGEEERRPRIEKSKSPDIHNAADGDKEYGDSSASALSGAQTLFELRCQAKGVRH